MARVFNFAIITVSDSRDLSTDVSGDCLKEEIEKFTPKNNVKFVVVRRDVVQDDEVVIVETLNEVIDLEGVSCVITTGGTGFSARDVTPEATRSLIVRETPGISLAILMYSLKKTPMAALSRLVSGITANNKLVINFPGSPKACRESFEAIQSILGHALEQLDQSSTNHLHQNPLQPAQNPQDANSHCCRHGEKHGTRRIESRFEMFPLEDAFSILRELCVNSEQKQIVYTPIEHAHDLCGRVLGTNIENTKPFPPFPASTRDGFALMASDTSETGQKTLKIVDASHAGHGSSVELQTGFCTKISTGAPLPKGADCVVMIEDVVVEGGNITVLNKLVTGENVRPVGSDLAVGVVFREGDLITPPMIGMLAGLGVSKVPIYASPKVSIFSTGDEVVEAGSELTNPYFIYDSNGPLLSALLHEDRFKPDDVHNLGIVKDTRDALKQKFVDAFECSKIVITSGGVSMGERDYIKDVLEQDFGAKIHIGRVNMKPGKPFTFATLTYSGQTKFVFALPGNPVSVFVCYHVFVRPAIYKLRYNRVYKPVIVRKKLALEFPYRLDTRPEYIRVSLDGEVCRITDYNQCSSSLKNSANAEGLALLPSALNHPDRPHINDGHEVDVLLF